MKRIIIFVGLKIVEISALVFIPYWLGHLGGTWLIPPRTVVEYWQRGAAFIVLTAIPTIALALIVSFNWGVAGKLKQRFWRPK